MRRVSFAAGARSFLGYRNHRRCKRLAGSKRGLRSGRAAVVLAYDQQTLARTGRSRRRHGVSFGISLSSETVVSGAWLQTPANRALRQRVAACTVVGREVRAFARRVPRPVGRGDGGRLSDSTEPLPAIDLPAAGAFAGWGALGVPEPSGAGEFHGRHDERRTNECKPV